MKRCLVVLCVTLLALSVVAQVKQPPTPTVGGVQTNKVVRANTPTYSDVYCSGFMTSPEVSKASYVVGGWQSLDTSRFAKGDYVYIAGPPLPEGSEHYVVRELRDPNQWEGYPGQRALAKSVGDLYADLGRVKIITRRGNVNVAQVIFSCEPMVAGDVLMPFVERQTLEYRPKLPFDRFTPASGKLIGRIVMAKDFDQVAGDGRKVYLNVGGANGVKPGDYFRVVVPGDQIVTLPIDALSGKAPLGEETQKNPVELGRGNNGKRIEPKEFPRKAIAEMMVLNVSNKSATAIITSSLQEVKIGDNVELEDPYVAPPPPPPPTPIAPQITCSARPTTVRAGETATVSCAAGSPDDRPVTVAFASDRGRVSANGSTGTLDTTGLPPGPVTVTATAADDRNLSSSTTAGINVVAAPAPPGASKTGDITFKPNSARVDNKAKAILDDLALRLQRETDAKVMVNGLGDTATPAGTKLAAARADNVRTYLTKDKGIDPARVSTKSGQGGDDAELWWVPAGAAVPQ